MQRKRQQPLTPGQKNGNGRELLLLRDVNLCEQLVLGSLRTLLHLGEHVGVLDAHLPNGRRLNARFRRL